MSGSTASELKTVYVVGAGFSRSAQVPLQSEILQNIRDTNPLSTPEILIEMFTACQGRSIGFVNKIFEHVSNPSLEDVFTLIDQSIQRRHHCVGYDWQSLENVRSALCKAIVVLFHAREKKIPEARVNFYNAVAAYFVEERLKAGQEGDPFSIISLNWDCVLENAIYWCLDQCDGKKIDIDYCCYTNPFDGTSRHKPSLTQKARGLYNIKLLKLHGSVNWVLCPNCNRLFVGLGAPDDLMAIHIAGKTCPDCAAYEEKAQDSTRTHGPLLEPFIITPTFLKEFNNAHIQMVWHNAYIELREAQKVVFIGYSLPQADYHLRTLLKRAIQPNTEIVIVLTKDDKPPFLSILYPNIRDKYADSRFQAFFGNDSNVKFLFDGVEGYFADVAREKVLSSRIDLLREICQKLNS